MQEYLYESVEPLGKNECRKLLEPIFPHIWWCANEPFEQFKNAQLVDKDMRDYAPGEIAQWLWPKVVRRARYVSGSTKDMREIDLHGKPAFQFRSDLILIFKKLTHRRQPDGSVRLCRSNYKTRGNNALWAQKKKQGVPALPRFVVGTVLEREATTIRTVIGLPEANQPFMEWYFTINNQSASLSSVFNVPKEQLKQEQERKGFTIIPIKEDKERGAQ